MRNSVLIGLLTTELLAAPGGAQQSNLGKLKSTTPEQRAEFLTQDMTSELTLSVEQASSVQALNLKYAKLQQPLLEGQGDGPARMRQVRTLNSQKMSSLRKLLSDEQWTKFERGRSERKKRFEAWASTMGEKPQP